MLPTGLMTPRIWRPSSRDLIDPYAVTDEPQPVAPLSQRLRQPVTIGVSVLIVASAVYLGFLHNDDTVDSTPIAVSGKVTTQNLKPSAVLSQRTPPATTPRNAPAVVAQTPVRPAPVRSAPIPPAPAPQASRRAAVTVTASAQARRNPGGPTNTVPAKVRADASRQIRSARANLQQNNLAATRTRLAAAIAAQPDNPDAQRMREALAAREQQRDALLSVARGCSYVGHWGCVWFKAGDALLVDSSSKEAHSLVSLAVRQTEVANAGPATPTPETADERSLVINHH
jgi:hypothetical protein